MPLSPLARSVTGSTTSFLLQCRWLAAPAAPALLLCKREGNIALQGTACPGFGEDLEVSCVLKGNCFSIQEVFSKYDVNGKSKPSMDFLALLIFTPVSSVLSTATFHLCSTIKPAAQLRCVSASWPGKSEKSVSKATSQYWHVFV